MVIEDAVRWELADELERILSILEARDKAAIYDYRWEGKTWLIVICS